MNENQATKNFFVLDPGSEKSYEQQFIDVLSDTIYQARKEGAADLYVGNLMIETMLGYGKVSDFRNRIERLLSSSFEDRQLTLACSNVLDMDALRIRVYKNEA
jgi:hypothetical protein